MSTWKDLDLSNKDKEKEAKICLMVGTTFEESELEQKDEVDLDDPESLKQAYHELFSNSSIL